MHNRERFVFWRLANLLIVENGYRVIQLFENQRELWLEKLDNKNAPIIRMIHQNLDWSNAMQRDIEFAAGNGERVRKQLRLREINIVNVYISEFPPVDDYEFRLKTPFEHPEGNKTKVSSVLLAKDKMDHGFQRLTELLGKDVHFPIKDEYQEQEIELLKKNALQSAIQKIKAEKAVFSNGKPFFTYVFLILQVAMFFWLELHGGSTNTVTLIKYGAKVNSLIDAGEWWRLLTPIFLHIGFVHLAMNSLALYFLGTAVERMFGNIRFLFIYLFAGVTGFIGSFIFSSNLSAGASGAIYGCFGALLFFGAVYPKLFFRTIGTNVLVILAINLVFGFTASGIDVAGHLGGLVGGFLSAGIVYLPKQKRWLWQVVFLSLSAVIIWSALAYGFNKEKGIQDEGITATIVQEYVKQGEYDKAYSLLKDTLKNEINVTEKTYFLLSFVEIKKGMLDDAKSHLEKAIQLDPSFHEAYFNLALINIEQNDLQEAKQHIEKAIKLNPDQKDYQDLLQEINQYLQSSDEGV